MTRKRDEKGRSTQGRWLPSERRLRAFVNKQFLLTWFFGAFAFLVIALGERVPPELKLYTVALSALVTVALGVTADSWWHESTAVSKNRQLALNICYRMEEEMRRISGNWRQIILALRTLVTNPDPEFIKATEYLIGSQQAAAESTLQGFASEIDRLGFDPQEFQKEMRERFVQLKAQALETLATMPGEESPLLQIFRKVEPELTSKVLENKNNSAMPQLAESEPKLEGQLKINTP